MNKSVKIIISVVVIAIISIVIFFKTRVVYPEISDATCRKSYIQDFGVQYGIPAKRKWKKMCQFSQCYANKIPYKLSNNEKIIEEAKKEGAKPIYYAYAIFNKEPKSITKYLTAKEIKEIKEACSSDDLIVIGYN